MILLDSNVIIEILEKKSKKGEEAYSTIIESGETVCTTAINLHEVAYGLKKYGKPTRELLRIPIVDYSKEAALLSSDIEFVMEKSGNPIRRVDSMIASVAINGSMKLFTLDDGHFNPITKRFALKLL